VELPLTTDKEEIARLVQMVEEVILEKEHLLDAIREHRARKTPASWSQEDARLYEHLPEVRVPGLGPG
jgi:hypothetical protein